MSNLERWWNPIPDVVKAEIKEMIRYELERLESKPTEPDVVPVVESAAAVCSPVVVGEVAIPPAESVVDGTPSAPVAEWDAAGEVSDID